MNENDEISVPLDIASSTSLENLAETARDYARQAISDNTNKAYASDWEHFSSWCRRRGADPLSGPHSDSVSDRHSADP